MMMKNYLNNQEIKEALILTYCKVLVEHFTKGNVMTKSEKTNLKKGGTYIKNSIKSMIERLGEETAKKYVRLYNNSRITVITDSEIDIISKRKKAEINAAYEDSREYFDLVEITMDMNCKDCKKCFKSCSLYKHFEEQEMPAFNEERDGEILEDLGNCKYAYRSDEIEKS